MTKQSVTPYFHFATAVAISAVLAGAPQTVGAQSAPGARWLTVVMPAEPPELDGCQSSLHYVGRVLKQNVNETLVEKDPKDGSIKPRLAVSWERKNDNEWHFKLRPGVFFHDGSPLDAAAVKRSIERNETKTFRCNDIKFLGDVPYELSVLDPLTLVIKTTRPEPILTTRLASVAIVSPKTPMDKLVLQPVGTGPYMFDSWQPNQQILLKRNPNYWGQQPQAEGVRYLFRAESAVRASMVGVGEADLAFDVDDSEDQGSPNAQTLSTFTASFYLRLDTTLAPFNDKRVRLAMGYAVDRAALIGTVLPKETTLATQIVLPTIPGHNHELDKRQRPYDLAKAKQLIAEAKAAGTPVDTEILFITYPTSFPRSAELMEALYHMYTAIGLNLKVIAVEPGDYARWNAKPYPEPRPPTVLQANHDNITGDPFFSVNAKYGCQGVNSMFCDPAVEKEIQRATAASGQERIAAWQGIFQSLYEDHVPDVPLYHMVASARVNKRINFQLDPTIANELRVQEITFK